MAENLSFDFKTAVAQSLRDYPQLRDNTVFIDVAENRSYDEPLVMHGYEKAKLKVLARELDIQEDLSRFRQTGDSFVKSDITQSYFAIILGEKKIAVIDESPFYEYSRFFWFNHELGHVLTKRTVSNSAFPVSECSADAFASLRLIQEFDNAIGALEHVSWFRSYRLLERGQSTHFTTPVIDKIIFDSQTQDFSKLSPLETVELAKKYADDYTPVFKNIQNAKAEHREFTDASDGDMHRKLSCLASTCLKTSDDFSFYIGSRVFNAFFHPEGKVLKDQTISLADRQDFRRLQAEILGHSERFENLAPHQKLKGDQKHVARL